MPIFVNDTEISDDQVFREMQHHPAEDRETAMKMAAEALTIRELLLQAYVSEGLGPREGSEEGDPEADDDRIQTLLDTVIKVPEADEETARRYFENNKSEFASLVPDGLPTFDKMKQVIIDFLRDSSWRTSVTQYIKILAGKAKLAGIDLEAAETPLVR
ncbi:hypothetical protein PQU92_14250 [Asticcacaulis sp. BYS171W]|uniref:Uncharacterized protein n=1 Tax=Asticcacaulis aquaticus TaxID=2984212 RepID=A0ABT5HWT9_9CAUL|nr:hypothetical protein [Asticcacaulis aquaticus]MDC7684444.1 hypothetical protein [Asticcacaulis aquaticus]